MPVRSTDAVIILTRTAEILWSSSAFAQVPCVEIALRMSFLHVMFCSLSFALVSHSTLLDCKPLRLFVAGRLIFAGFGCTAALDMLPAAYPALLRL